MNDRITPKERGLLKGSIRRVFARSELRRKVLATASITHIDPERKRVKKWSKCPLCGLPTPTYLMQVDHISPVIPLDKTFEEIGLDQTVDRTWCNENNLMPVCKTCHTKKTKEERKARKELKNGK